MALTRDDTRPAAAPAPRVKPAVPRIPDIDHRGVDRRYRAKVMIVMVTGCLALWGAVGYLLIRVL